MDAAALGLPVLIALIAVALVFDFLNGLHDAANSIATVVATRVLRPQTAVVWAAFFNFVAFAVFGLHVATTVGTGIVSAGVVDGSVIFGALTGAIVWNVVTWALGIPSSSSHALIGGLAGAAIAKAGLAAVVFSGLGITALGIVLSPLLGFILAQLLVLIAPVIRRDAVRRRPPLSRLQLVSAALYSLGHAATTRRRPWASSRCCSSRACSTEFHVPFWVASRARRDGARR
jgi:PiT family inorganic phosphate transporter